MLEYHSNRGQWTRFARRGRLIRAPRPSKRARSPAIDRQAGVLGRQPVAQLRMEQLLAFIHRNAPSTRMVLTFGPLFLVWAYGCLSLAGYLKVRRGIRTGYTRKTFHVLTFLTAAAIQTISGLPLVCLFGAATTLVLAYALVRGDGHPLYEAIAREGDTPHRTYYIVIPYLATLMGGVAGSIWFGPASLIGYLVVGLGDAAGEPVGTRWGKRRYVVPTLSRVKTTRTVEGSIGVFVASLVAITVGMTLAPGFAFKPQSIVAIPALALICALMEAISPHGWDNATMQLAPAFLAGFLL
jgi:phytol kinase